MPHLVGLISDTHGWLHPHLGRYFAGAELIIHAGDIGHPDVLDGLAAIGPVAAVKGNIDGGVLAHLDVHRVVTIGGKRIAVLHIGGSPHHPRAEARSLIALAKPDVIVVGHSHIPVVGRVDGVLWLNPGAAGNQGFHEVRTAMRLHIEDDGELRLEAVELGLRGSRVQSE